MFKRARVAGQDAADDFTCEDTAVTSSKHYWGQEFRKFLLDKFCMEGMSGADVATISFLATQAGCLGLRDLSVRPEAASKHGHEHVRAAAGDIYPETDLFPVRCPVYDKRDARRTAVSIPMYRPSTAFSNYITDDMIDMVSQESQMTFDRIVGHLDNYHQHPVVLQAAEEGFPTRVRPIALYWDGVAYTKHDSFTGFYVTDILTSQKFVSFLLRTALSC